MDTFEDLDGRPPHKGGSPRPRVYGLSINYLPRVCGQWTPLGIYLRRQRKKSAIRQSRPERIDVPPRERYAKGLKWPRALYVGQTAGLAVLMLLPLVGSYDRLSRVTTASVIVLDPKMEFLLACAGQMLTSRPQPFCFLVGPFF